MKGKDTAKTCIYTDRGNIYLGIIKEGKTVEIELTLKAAEELEYELWSHIYSLTEVNNIKDTIKE